MSREPSPSDPSGAADEPVADAPAQPDAFVATGSCMIEGGGCHSDVTRTTCVQLAGGRKFTWIEGGDCP